MIKSSSIEALKMRLDIVDIIGGYIDLKKAGSHYSACCPFHAEKTPSFMVNPVKNVYHCYGCGAGGDSITFIMEYEKLDFIGAIERLAEISGFELEYEDVASHRKKNENQHAFDEMINFYHNKLLENRSLIEYLHGRGVSQDSIDRFKLGYCPGNVENLSFCDRNHIDKNKLVELAILGYDQGRYYARFQDRIMFPIYGVNAKPVGFGGRTLRDDMAKYINSPQSPFFNKSKLLYGYHLAKEHIYREGKIIITEGYLDVIMLHQAGFKCAVATLGTALTTEHIPLISKGDPYVILSYDGDKAGIKAAFRASQILAQKEGGVVLFENGLDPADMVAQNRLAELDEKFSKPMAFIEFVLRHIIGEYDLKNPLQKEKALNESLKFLHTLSPILQDSYRALIAQLLDINPTFIGVKNNKAQKIQSTVSNIPSTSNEALILAYILEDNSLLDVALDYIDGGVFFEYRDGFDALLRGEFTHPSLTAILNNPQVMIPNDDKEVKMQRFTKELALLILRYNYGLLDSIQKDSSLSFMQKSTRIKTIKNNILKLKQGELIPYESISTF